MCDCANMAGMAGAIEDVERGSEERVESSVDARPPLFGCAGNSPRDSLAWPSPSSASASVRPPLSSSSSSPSSSPSSPSSPVVQQHRVCGTPTVASQPPAVLDAPTPSSLHLSGATPLPRADDY